MTKAVSSYELTLRDRPRDQTLANWLYAELRSAILQGRLAPETRLPASRDFALQYGLSRGTVVNALERLQGEGYLCSRVGSGTWVGQLPTAKANATNPGNTTPAYARRVAAAYERPKCWVDITRSESVRPFQMGGPAITEVPAKLWGSLAARRARTFQSWVRTEDDGRGYRPLRQAIANYVALSRGVRCNADQIVVVSGAQQGLDLLGRFLLNKDDPIWMEDPGYFGAQIAFSNVGAKIIPVPVDDQGLDVTAGLRLSPHAKGAYVTPAHQYPLGMTMSLQRRMALLKWASRVGAFVIEDDYDSEYRFEGRPVPALQSLDQNSNVILVGTFTKLLFPSLRIGYLIMPSSLMDLFLAFRYRTDFRNLNLDQAVLCDFIEDGHLGRHLRRMRGLYSSRLEALTDGGNRYLRGLLKISDVRAGLYTVGFLENGMGSRQAEKAATMREVDVAALDRYTLKCPDPRGILLGFAAFDEVSIQRSLRQLAAAFDRKRAGKFVLPAQAVHPHS